MSKRNWTPGPASQAKGYRVCWYKPGGVFSVTPGLKDEPLGSLMLARDQAKMTAEDLGNTDICIVDNVTLQVRSVKPLNVKRLQFSKY
jgi:hypothetical protein